MDYVKFVYRPLAARAARQALVGRNRAQRSPDRGRFTRADVDTLLKTAWGDYAERVVKLPPEPTVGSRMNVKLACFTMSFFNALLGIGTERAYAIELVADAAWRVYRLWSSHRLGAGPRDARKDHLARLRRHKPWRSAWARVLELSLQCARLPHRARSRRPWNRFRRGQVPDRGLFSWRGGNRSVFRVLVQPRLCACRVDSRETRSHQDACPWR